MNILLLGNIIIMLLLDLIMSLILLGKIKAYGDGMWYVYPDGADATLYFTRALGSYFVLLNNMIPLDLVITMEIAKIILSKIMEKDPLLFCEKN